MKIKKLYIFLFTFAILFASATHAQQRVAVGIGSEATMPQVMLKFVDEKVIFPGGITVYHSADRQAWQKLTTKPLKLGDYTPTHARRIYR